ncbi:MAG TPA: hypothetical protein VFW00_13380 [Rhodocyclaceae bacterium]|nr:hypothetical protein [Rhodocyclaceae bacterium]
MPTTLDADITPADIKILRPDYGPSDNSDSASDVIGTVNEDSDSDSAGTGERDSVEHTPAPLQTEQDIAPDKTIRPLSPTADKT